jgi:hypothetical protein
MRIGRGKLGNVGQIYRHSWCNLAAKDGRDGILRFPDRQPHSSKALIVDVPDMGQPKFHEPGESALTSFELRAWRGSPLPRRGMAWQSMAPGPCECVD